MYSKFQLQVKCENKLSPKFQSFQGVRQGDNLSPTLFNIFINDLNFPTQLCDPAKLLDEKISHLLYADDLLIISESPTGLQQSLNYLENYCSMWGLEINMTKTNVMEITNKQKRCNTQFFLGRKEIQVCDCYRYLGILIDNKGRFQSAIEDLKAKGLKALFKLNKNIQNCDFPVQVQSKLFDATIKPIILYIWRSGD